MQTCYQNIFLSFFLSVESSIMKVQSSVYNWFSYFSNSDVCRSTYGCEWCDKCCNKADRPDPEQFCGYKGKCWKPCETNGTKQNVVAIVVSIEVILLLIVGLLIIWCWLFRKSQQPAEQNNREEPERPENDNPNFVHDENLEAVEVNSDDLHCWIQNMPLPFLIS